MPKGKRVMEFRFEYYVVVRGVLVFDRPVSLTPQPY